MSIKPVFSAALAAAALTFAPAAWANGDDDYYDDHDDAYYDDYRDDYYDDRFAGDAIVDPYPDEVIVRTEILRTRRAVPGCCGARGYGYGYRYGPVRRAIRRCDRRVPRGVVGVFDDDAVWAVGRAWPRPYVRRRCCGRRHW